MLMICFGGTKKLIINYYRRVGVRIDAPLKMHTDSSEPVEKLATSRRTGSQKLYYDRLRQY